MKKILLIIFIFFISLALYIEVKAFSLDNNPPIVISGYGNYAPIGIMAKNNKFNTIFTPVINIISQQQKQLPSVKTYKLSDLENIEKDIRIGKVDVFLGGYNQTERFENLDLLFPAVTHNPVTFFMLPSNAHLIKSFDDLKKLKGIRYSQEIFSDFVENKLEEYNLESSSSTYEIYEKLFTRKVDYIISGYYFGMIEAIKLGVSRQIAVSKQPLWNIPLFIGVSKISPRHDTIAKAIVRHIQDEEFINQIKENLKKSLEFFEQEYSGVVPPTFGLENAEENQDTLITGTPISFPDNISAE